MAEYLSIEERLANIEKAVAMIPEIREALVHGVTIDDGRVRTVKETCHDLNIGRQKLELLCKKHKLYIPLKRVAGRNPKISSAQFKQLHDIVFG